RYAARVIEPQLRLQLPLDARRRGREDELDVVSPSRHELETGAEKGFQPVQTGTTLIDAKHLLEPVGVVRLRNVDHGACEQGATTALKLLGEGAEYTRAPISRRYDRNAHVVSIAQHPTGDQPRFLDGRESELEKKRRRLLTVGQEIERQQRRPLHSVRRRGGHRLPGEWSHDDVGARLGCCSNRICNGLLAARVVDADHGPLLHRGLVVRAQELVTYAGRQSTRRAGDG